jgi:MFS family permease
VGFLLDHSKTARRLCPLYLLAVLGLLILLVAHGTLPILAAAVLIGIGMAGEFSALSYLISRYFGRKALGTISGVGFGLMTVVISVTTVMLNAIYDRTGSYRLAILAVIPFLVWNVVAPLLMGRYRYDASNDVASETASGLEPAT